MLDKIKNHLTLNNVVLIAALVLAGSWAVGAVNVMNHNYDLQRQLDQAKLDNQIIELTNQNLQLEQAYYKTDEFLNLQARALLGKANPGEHLVILPKVNSASSNNQTSTTTTTAQKSNLAQWMEFLFGQRN